MYITLTSFNPNLIGVQPLESWVNWPFHPKKGYKKLVLSYFLARWDSMLDDLAWLLKFLPQFSMGWFIWTPNQHFSVGLPSAYLLWEQLIMLLFCLLVYWLLEDKLILVFTILVLLVSMIVKPCSLLFVKTVMHDYWLCDTLYCHLVLDSRYWVMVLRLFLLERGSLSVLFQLSWTKTIMKF